MNLSRNFVDAIILTIAFFAGFYLVNTFGLPQLAENNLIALGILFMVYVLIATGTITLIRYLRGENIKQIQDRKIDRFTKKFAVSQVIALLIAVGLVFGFPVAGNFITSQGLLIQGGLLGLLEAISVVISDKWLVK